MVRTIIQAGEGPTRLVGIIAVTQVVVIAVVGRGDLGIILIGKTALGKAGLAIIDQGRVGCFIIENLK